MPTPPRRFWQIHLSTAIVMMFVAAAMLYLNAVPHQVLIPNVRCHTRDNTISDDSAFYVLHWGWPIQTGNRVQAPQHMRGLDRDVYLDIGDGRDDRLILSPASLVIEQNEPQKCIPNALIAFLIVIAVAIPFEYLQRRRA